MKRILLLLPLLATLATLGVHAGDTLDLAGKWKFQIDDARTGVTAKWFAAPLAGDQQIKLPGTMDDAGLGPKNTNAPTLEGPYRLYNYAGPAWYQREIEIPSGWQGKRVTLLLERCRWVTSVWLDDRFIGSQDSLIAPHLYDFGTAVAPGKHRLTLCVDNTVKIDLGRFVSALFGGTWGNMNGVVGRLELAATPPVWIEDVQVYPDVKQMQARVVVKIGNATGQAGSGPLLLGKQSVAAAWDKFGGHAEAVVDLTGAKLWDEFHPDLTTLAVKLGADQRTVTFGMRDFAAQGTQFTLNGRTVSLRGTLECSVFPLTGYPPCDVASWQRIFRIEKSYGLNFVRFHSWCPPEAAFAAADREGILIQAEGPMANVTAGRNADRDEFIQQEMKRMVDTYGNHPSFCLMTLGNEYGGSMPLLTGWVQALRDRDPRHLYSSASSNRQRTENRQFTEKGDGRGIHGPGTEHDLKDIVAGDTRPIIGHEIGQWMFFPDFKEMKKYSGVMAVKNFEMVRDDLAKKHLLDLAPDYVAASGPFAVLLYKEEIENLLRTPGYGGFSLLDLHDYPTQGTALIGLLDPFWDSKGFITPKQFRRFCSPTVPLLRMPKRTYTNTEPFAAVAEISHFGPADLAGAQPVWSIKDASGHTVASGQLAPLTVPSGKLTELGEIQASLAGISKPTRLSVNLSLAGTGFANDWDIWVYPASAAPQPPANVTVSTQWTEAKAALAAGQTVVLFPSAVNASQSLAGKFLPVFWSPVWFPTQKPNTMGLLCDPRHPLFAQFPTEKHSDWQWYDLMQHSRYFILDDTAADYRPTVQVIDNFARNHKLGVIFEGRVGPGRLLVSGFDLPQLGTDPAARQLLAGLYAYVGSAKFHPTGELNPNFLDNLFTPAKQP